MDYPLPSIEWGWEIPGFSKYSTGKWLVNPVSTRSWNIYITELSSALVKLYTLVVFEPRIGMYKPQCGAPVR